MRFITTVLLALLPLVCVTADRMLLDEPSLQYAGHDAVSFSSRLVCPKYEYVTSIVTSRFNTHEATVSLSCSGGGVTPLFGWGSGNLPVEAGPCSAGIAAIAAKRREQYDQYESIRVYCGGLSVYSYLNNPTASSDDGVVKNVVCEAPRSRLQWMLLEYTKNKGITRVDANCTAPDEPYRRSLTCPDGQYITSIWGTLLPDHPEFGGAYINTIAANCSGGATTGTFGLKPSGQAFELSCPKGVTGLRIWQRPGADILGLSVRCAGQEADWTAPAVPNARYLYCDPNALAVGLNLSMAWKSPYLGFSDLQLSCIQPVRVQLCDGDSRQVACGTGQWLKLMDVFYGRSSQSVCPLQDGSTTSNGGCSLPNAKASLDASCDQQSSCTLDPSSLPDPCWGVPKYLDVAYTCAQSECARAKYNRTGGFFPPNCEEATNSCYKVNECADYGMYEDGALCKEPCDTVNATDGTVMCRRFECDSDDFWIVIGSQCYAPCGDGYEFNGDTSPHCFRDPSQFSREYKFDYDRTPGGNAREVLTRQATRERRLSGPWCTADKPDIVGHTCYPRCIDGYKRVDGWDSSECWQNCPVKFPYDCDSYCSQAPCASRTPPEVANIPAC